jgi:flavin reductase (DIM6/NTAB) family NADH-FMN oxidoreductase RutF
MKIELPTVPPAHFKEQWDGQFSMFSYYVFTIGVPAPVFIVTALKENGLPNAALSAWGMIAGSGAEPKFILQAHNYTDTRRLLVPGAEFVINYPSMSILKAAMKTVGHFGAGEDELLASGLRAEPSKLVKPPRVAECFACLECRVDWTRDIETEKKMSTLVQGSVVHAALDDSALRDGIRETHALRRWIFNIQESVNPVNGAAQAGLMAELDIDGAISADEL